MGSSEISNAILHNSVVPLRLQTEKSLSERQGKGPGRGRGRSEGQASEHAAYPLLLLHELLQLLAARLKPLCVLPSQREGHVRLRCTWDGDVLPARTCSTAGPPILVVYGAFPTTSQGLGDLPAGWSGPVRRGQCSAWLAWRPCTVPRRRQCQEAGSAGQGDESRGLSSRLRLTPHWKPEGGLSFHLDVLFPWACL